MDSALHRFLLLLLLASTFPFVFLPSAAAIGRFGHHKRIVRHNITKLLSRYSDFGTFNSLLSQTRIAREINRRQTITVLALDDSAAGAISGLPKDTLTNVLAVHVVLDYYDNIKIRKMKRRSTLFTTLFQTTGVAEDRMGFLNFTRLGRGHSAFGSALPGSSLVSILIKQVATKPYSLSVLQVSGAIVPQGISDEPLVPFGSAPILRPGQPPSPAPAPEEDAQVPAPEEDAPVLAPERDAPVPAPEADAPGPESSDMAPAADYDDYEDDSAPGRQVAGVAVGAAAGVVLLCLC